MAGRVEHHGRTVETRIAIAAPPRAVYDAWADGRRLCGWFADRTKGRAAAGETYTWLFDRFQSEFPYEVAEAKPPRRLVLKGAPIGRPPYILEIEVAPAGEGCDVRIVNSGFAVGAENEEEFEGVRSGWAMSLALLKEYVERHFGESKTPFFAMQPAAFEYEVAARYFTEEERLGRWLTRAGSLGREGEPFTLTLWDGAAMSGRILCRTPREVALSWEELHGVLELKSFRIGPRTRAVCARGFGWGLSEEAAELIEQSLKQAIDRLVADLGPAGG